MRFTLTTKTLKAVPITFLKGTNNLQKGQSNTWFLAIGLCILEIVSIPFYETNLKYIVDYCSKNQFEWKKPHNI